MSQQTVKQLPAETTKLITSTQIVTSVSTAIKELVENSIDAGARVIQIRLENYGLDLIEVKDDGSGVSYDNVQKMFLSGYTSKIREFQDLEQLGTYGFRGEALSALCKIAKVSITTKTSLDTLAMIYEIDPSGVPLSSKPTHLTNGTVITVSNLFSNLPVRRLFLSSKKQLSEELKKTEHVVQSLLLIHPELSVSLIHNKCSIWKKNSVRGIKQSFMQVVGLKTTSKMELLNESSPNQINIELIVPKKNLDNIDSVFTNSLHSVYVYVNKRPVNCKNLIKPVQEHIFHYFSSFNVSFKYAISLVSVIMSPQQMDINLEPNKTKILLKNQMDVIKLIDKTLSNYYGHQNFKCSLLKDVIVDENINNEEVEEHPPKRAKIVTTDPSVGEKRSKDFKEKNKDWRLEIINEDCNVNFELSPSDLFQGGGNVEPSCPQNLCSQINSTNSLLTREEVSQVNTLLTETKLNLVTSTNSKNSETRLVDRNDIQCKNVEKSVLPEWPCRPKPTVATPSNVNMLKSTSDKIKSEAVEILAAELEKDAENFSNDLLAMNTEKGKEEALEKSYNLTQEIENFDLSMQSISSQMGKKELKAFTKFSRIMRPKIIAEFPNIMFTQVAGILVQRWKNLSTDEVKYYEKMSEVVDLNRKIHEEEKRIENLKPPEKTVSRPNKTTNLKSIFEQMKKRSKINRPPRMETSLTAFLSVIKTLRSQMEPPVENDSVQIIGQLQPSGNWLYKRGNDIGHLRHQGLQELIMYQKMLSSYVILRKPLEKPNIITEEMLSTSLWNILVTLETSFDKVSSKHVIVSDVITKNGFQIEIDKKGVDISSVSIVENASNIPHYGISDLKDILRNYEKSGEIGGLASWRPTSVCNYITNEVIRVTQQSTKPPSREELEEMLNTYNLCLAHLPPVCLHSKDIFISIYQIKDDLCSAQSQSQICENKTL